MGMFDEIWWEAELPAGHSPTSRLFQTKSFDSCMDRYVVTDDGKLRLVGNSLQDHEPFEGGQSHHESVDVDFHGDMRMGSAAEGRYVEYVVRFTHGRLEWIRPSSEVKPLFPIPFPPVPPD